MEFLVEFELPCCGSPSPADRLDGRRLHSHSNALALSSAGLAEPGDNVPPDLRRASDVLVGAYHGVTVKPGKGVPHARAVARALRLAGCSAEVQVAGLLHDLVEDTGWTVAGVQSRFGRRVAALVQAVTENDAIVDYRPRKQALREQIARAGPDAIDIALADKIASLRHVLSSGGKLSKRKRAHYRAITALGGQAAHPALAVQVGQLLARVDGRDRPAVAGVRA